MLSWVNSFGQLPDLLRHSDTAAAASSLLVPWPALKAPSISTFALSCQREARISEVEGIAHTSNKINVVNVCQVKLLLTY